MMTAKEIRELQFERVAWGYRPEDVDEFLSKLEATFQEIDNEREDSNHKIQISRMRCSVPRKRVTVSLQKQMKKQSRS